MDAKAAPYRATGNGVTDDTLALRHALTDLCSAHGGTLRLPAGTYKISPQSPNDMGALIWDCDYPVTIEGAGADLTTLSRYTIGDTNPDTACPVTTNPDAIAVNYGKVNRGAGIFVQTSTAHPRSGFTLRDLTLDGNRTAHTGMQGSNSFPATTSNCSNVWDLSDKGLYVRQDREFDNLIVQRVHIRNFSGELIYGGSQTTHNWTLSDNELDHGNGDAISVAAALVSERNRIHDVPSDGYENQPYGVAQPQMIRANTISNIGLDAVAIVITDPAYYAQLPAPPLDISANTITNAGRTGIFIQARAGHVYDNTILDAATGVFVGFGGTTNIPPQNITVEHNRIFAAARANTTGIETSGGVSSHLVIRDNATGTTEEGVAAGIHMVNGLQLTDEGATDLTEERNTQRNTLYSDTMNMAATNVRVTGTAPQQIVSYRPNRNHDRLFHVSVSLRVVNATTSVRVSRTYTGPGGTVHKDDLLRATGLAVGTYTLPLDTILASGLRGNWTVSVSVTASRANNVYVTAAIEPAGR